MAYLRGLRGFYLFSTVKDGIIPLKSKENLAYCPVGDLFERISDITEEKGAYHVRQPLSYHHNHFLLH